MKTMYKRMKAIKQFFLMFETFKHILFANFGHLSSNIYFPKTNTHPKFDMNLLDPEADVGFQM